MRHGGVLFCSHWLQHVEDVECAVFVNWRKIEIDAPGILCACTIPFVFSAQKAPGQRAPDHQTNLLIQQQWREFAFQIPARNGVIGLQRYKFGEAVLRAVPDSLHDMPGGEVAAPDIAHFSAFYQGVQCIYSFFQWGQRIKAMDLVQVHIIHLKSLQTGVNFMQDVLAAQTRTIRRAGHSAAYFGGNHEVFAFQTQVADRLPGHFFRKPFGVYVCGIQKIDAAVHRCAHQVIHCLLIEGSNSRPEASSAKSHSPKAKFGDFQSGVAQ